MARSNIKGYQARAQSVIKNYVAQQRDGIKRARNAIVALHDIRVSLTLFLMMVTEKLGTTRHDVFLSSWGEKPTIHVSLYDVDGFKSPVVEGLLSFLSNEMDTANTTDWPNALNRDYHFKGDRWDVTAAVYVRDDSPTCRRVVDRVVTEEVVKYRIECD